MKLQTTKKAIKNGYYKIYAVGYCSLETLFEYSNPFAYSAGYYGWSCDYYDINGVCISTGYSPIGEPVPYEIERKYNEKAEKIYYNNNIPYDQKKEQLYNLQLELIKEIEN